jgi:tetratricopeptide (TPR) repeat protein
MTSPLNFRFDIFLRYHPAQRRWTQRLAERLDREGVRVWFDRWMLQPGSDRRLELQVGISESRWVGLVVSPEFVGNPWPSDELYSGFPHAPARQNQRLLPLLHSPCELTEPMQEADHGFDFTDSEEDPVLFEFRSQQLLAFLDPRRSPPQDLQRFRLQNSSSLATGDEEVGVFQSFLRSIQAAISRIARGEGLAEPPGSESEGARQILLLQFIQRLFQWNTADLQFERAEDWVRRNNSGEALKAFDRALNADPNFALAWSRRGDVLQRLGRYREAIDSYNGSLSINPYDEQTRLRLALIQGRFGKLKAAVINYDKVLEIDPESVIPWHNRGIRLMQLQRPRLAMNSLNQALRYAADRPEIWIARGHCAYRLHRYPAAAASFAQANKLHARRGKLWRYRADALMQANRTKSALECYKRALRVRRKDPITWHNLGVLLLRTQRYRQAREMLGVAIKLGNYTVSWYARGVVFQQMGDQRLALKHFERALEIQPDYFPAQYGRAEALQRLQEYPAALEAFEALLQSRPQTFACWFGRVTCLRRLRAWEEALRYSQQMIEIDDQHPLGWFALAMIHTDLEDWQEALTALNQVLQLTPADATALNNRGWVYCQLHRYQEALESVEQALQRQPQNPLYWHTLGAAQLGMGKQEAARESFRQALHWDPDLTVAQQAMADLEGSPLPLPDLRQIPHPPQEQSDSEGRERRPSLTSEPKLSEDPSQTEAKDSTVRDQ